MHRLLTKNRDQSIARCKVSLARHALHEHVSKSIGPDLPLNPTPGKSDGLPVHLPPEAASVGKTGHGAGSAMLDAVQARAATHAAKERITVLWRLRAPEDPPSRDYGRRSRGSPGIRPDSSLIGQHRAILGTGQMLLFNSDGLVARLLLLGDGHVFADS